jgi:hypothetical protein
MITDQRISNSFTCALRKKILGGFPKVLPTRFVHPEQLALSGKISKLDP